MHSSRRDFLAAGLSLPAYASARCAGCAECTVRCPYGLKGSARVGRAQELFAC
jgi:ferredoxin